jgi:hypothetical protein
MRLPSFTLFLALLWPFYSQAQTQCTEVPLSALQVIQKSNPTSKENEILKLGFDLLSENGKGATNARKYGKCWHSNTPQGKSLYSQVILWHTNTNTITLLLLDQDAYDNLRKSVSDRHSGTEGEQVVYGKMFRYTFVTQNVDGAEYLGIMLALQNQ